MLKIESLHVTIASVQALRGFSLEVQRGSMVGLVGRNGAGKTSLMRTVMGHLPASGGAVRFDGADLARLPRHARAGLGIGYMPEDRGLVPELTVEPTRLLGGRECWQGRRQDLSDQMRQEAGRPQAPGPPPY